MVSCWYTSTKTTRAFTRMLYLRKYYFKRDIISFQEDDTDLVYRYIYFRLSENLHTIQYHQAISKIQGSFTWNVTVKYQRRIQNPFKSLNRSFFCKYFRKHSILVIWLGFEYNSELHFPLDRWKPNQNDFFFFFSFSIYFLVPVPSVRSLNWKKSFNIGIFYEVPLIEMVILWNVYWVSRASFLLVVYLWNVVVFSWALATFLKNAVFTQGHARYVIWVTLHSLNWSV